MIKKILYVSLLVLGSTISADPLSKAIDNLERKPENIARDVYRNPYETISFFQLKPDMQVIELSPGSGWYTEILAPYLKDKGLLIAAHFNPKESEWRARMRKGFEKRIERKRYII